MNKQGEKYLRLLRAGMSKLYFERAKRPESEEAAAPERWARLQEMLRSHQPLSPTEMLCLISYDIEDNKVRRTIAKYLIRQGCTRVQKSVYMARLERKTYQDIAATLREIQEMYDNQDSILLMPVGEEQIQRLDVIGRNLQIEVLTRPGHTLIL